MPRERRVRGRASSDSRVMLRDMQRARLPRTGGQGRQARDLTPLVPGFTPETDVERRIADDPALYEGLAWGEPRPGHPEGAVAAHVADLLRTIEEAGETGDRRSELRFLALVHDAFKNRVHEWLPKVGV